jgi:ferric-dicitrate binding protein FerR (iron transport regulator)
VEETGQLRGPTPMDAAADGMPGAGPVPPAAPGTVPAPRGRPSDHRPGWRRVLPGALVAAAVAAIVGLGLWNVVLAADRQELQSTVAEQNAVMGELLSPGRATMAPLTHDGRSVATVVARGGELQVVTYGLSVNQAGATSYVVWGMDGDPVALGTFDVKRSQMDLQTVGSGLTGLDQIRLFGISLEPGQDAPPAPTDVVATGEVTS